MQLNIVVDVAKVAEEAGLEVDAVDHFLSQSTELANEVVATALVEWFRANELPQAAPVEADPAAATDQAPGQRPIGV